MSFISNNIFKLSLLLFPLLSACVSQDSGITVGPTAVVVPSAPSLISLELPTSSPNTVKQPTFKVDGVSAGQTVRIFSDSNCQTEVGSQISNSTSISITSNLLSFGTNTIYASVTDTAGTASACSTSFVTYQLRSDPSLSDLRDKTIDEDDELIVPFTALDEDDPSFGCSSVRASSSNIALLPLSSVFITGSGTSCSLKLIPRKDQFGEANVSLIANDETTQVTKSFKLTVNPVPDAPSIVLSKLALTFLEDAPSEQIILTISDPDPEAIMNCSQISFIPSSVVDVLISGSAPGCVATITPKLNQSGPGTILFTVSNGLSDSKSLGITISPVPDPPQITLSKNSLTMVEDQTSEIISVKVFDPDSSISCSQLSLSSSTLVSSASGGSAPNCTLSLTPKLNKNGTEDLIVIFKNDLEVTAPFNLTVTPVDDAPKIELSTNSISFTEDDEAKPFVVTVSDVDDKNINCSQVSVSGATNLLDPIIIPTTSSSCSLSLKPKSDTHGSGKLTFTVDNGKSDSKELSFSISEVPDAPTISLQSPSLSFKEDDSEQFVTVTISDKDSEINCTKLSVTTSEDLVTLGTPSPIPGGSATSLDCKVSVTPKPDLNGNGLLTFTVNTGLEASAELSFSISSVIDAPTIEILTPALSFKEDEIGKLVSLKIDDKDSPVSCSDVTVSPNSLLTASPITGADKNCSLTLTPVKDKFGMVDLTFIVNNGLEGKATLNVKVESVDDVPEISINNNSLSFVEDGALQQIQITLSDIDSEVNCSQVSASLSDLVSSALLTTSGKICGVNITPKENQNGSGDVVFTVNNGLVATTKLSFTISSFDDAPEIQFLPSLLNFQEDGALQTIQISLRDVDSEIDCSQLTMSSTEHVTALKVSNSGKLCDVSVKPNPDKHGTGEISFTVTNSKSVTQKLAYTVSAVDDAPVISLDKSSLSFSEDGLAQIVQISISDKDSATSCTQVSVGVNSLVSLGAVNVSGSGCSITVTPVQNLHGSSTLTFKVTNTLSAETLLSFIINSVDDAPVAVAVSGTLTEDIPGLITLSYTDIEGDKASVCTLSNLSNLSGTCSCDTAGVCKASVTTVAVTSNRIASFSYTVTANGEVSNSANASITVSANTPVLSYSVANGKVGQSISISPTINSRGASVTCSATTAPALPAGLSINSSCVISGTPTAVSSGSYTVTATNTAGSSTASASINITANTPVVSYTASSWKVGDSVSITPTINNQGASSTCSTTTTPALPSGLSINSSCVISGTPTAVSSGTYAVTATNSAGSSTASAFINISANTPVLSYSVTNGKVGQSISITPTIDSRGASVTCSATTTPALPSGLSINSSCVISGTPTAVSSGSYAVTATNSAGSSTASASITISANTPVVSYTATSGKVGESISITPAIETRGASVACSTTTTPALPAGLSINSSCVISGTPTAVSSGSYTVTATNSAGSSTASASINISANTPVVAYSSTSWKVGDSVSITPTINNQGASVTCSTTTTPALPSGLSINSSCVISGTPTAVSSGIYAVTATNSAGSSSASASISISANTPVVSYSSTSSWKVGDNVSITPTINNRGAAVTSCSISPALPSPLVINATTCAITGTPTAILSSTSYSVTATNSVGTNTPVATFSLSIGAGLPTISISPSSVSGTVSSLLTITPTVVSNGATTTCSITAGGALPSGVSLNASSCVISGTPTATKSATSYTITATNSAGSASAAVSITVNAAAPNLSYSGAVGTTGSVGSAMSIIPTSFDNRGSALSACTSSPSLPNGLTIDTATCVISGTPTAASAATSYTITATNSAGSSTSSVSLTVNASLPLISYTGSTGTSGSVGTLMTITPTTLNNRGASITNCTTSPLLSVGLSIDPTTCVISGTPNAVLSSTSYTVTATNSVGNGSATVTLSVAASAPLLSYTGATGTNGIFGSSMSVSPTSFNGRGSAVTGCSISPSLPSGLGINSSCVISGTPSALSASTSYTVTATNGVGSSNASVTLSVVVGTPVISYASATGTSGVVGSLMTITPTTLNNRGGGVTSCNTSPALPSGLSINATTCVISGTPSVSLTSTNFTVSAVNSAGTGTATVQLSVGTSTPLISYSGSTGTSGTFGTLMTVTPTTLNNQGATITACTSSPALPSGLSISAPSCVITGTPGATVSSGSYTISATNSNGTSTAQVTLTINPNTPVLSYTGSSGTTGSVGNAMSVVPTTLNTRGGNLSSCTSSPTLPTGLTIDRATCVISGTPSATSGATSYTITATNSAGSTTASVSLTINASVPVISYTGSTGVSGLVGSAMSVTPTTLNNSGSAIFACTTNPALPSGLNINPTTCVIYGTPSATLSTTSYTVTATNAAGNGTGTISLTINQNTPILSFSSAYSGTVGTALSITPTLDNRGASSTCSTTTTPALPSGLSINSSCVISGTPTAVSSGSYAVTATNSAGSSTASASITISANTPVLSYAATSGKVGESISISPTINHRGASATCSVTTTPALPAGLSINSSCVISGTPTAVSSGSYTVTASNSAGSSTASASITISANTPVIAYSSTSWKVGDSVSITPTIDSRGASVTCSATTTPALPAGLSINSSCLISGVPTAVSSGSYAVTATNSAGSSTVSASINISANTPVIAYSSTSWKVGDSVSITPTIDNRGASVTCSTTTTPALPAGLSINSSCLISGVPTAVSSGSYAVTASNSAGSSTASASINISANTPVVAYSSTSWKVGDSVSITPTINHRGASSTCSTTTTPALPSGLSINSSCVISGTPTAVSSGSYAVTASNTAGSSTASASIVISANTPVIAYSSTSWKVGDSVSITPTIDNRGASTTCSATTAPALPAGLSINSSCVISGTPTAVSSGSYSVTASNTAGSSTASASINITANTPIVSYTATSGKVGESISITPAINNRGASSTCSTTTTPALPAGLSINSSCIISGTPTAVSSGSYAVTASNTAGSSTASASITISANTPVIAYSSTSWKVGDSVSITPTIDSRGASVTCSATTTPALPAGLSINSSCVISGVPTAVSSGSYTVTASNSAGSSTAIASINITANTPILSYSVTNEKVGNSVSISPTINHRGASSTCSTTTTPALPSGLSINSSCVISGTPTAVSSGSYAVTATNSAGSSTASASITISANTPIVSYTATSGKVGESISITPAIDTRGASVTCSATTTPALPAGLSINSSCVISGVPTAVSSGSYTVTATNSAGSSTASASINISANTPVIAYSSTSWKVGVSVSITPTIDNRGASVTCSATTTPALPVGLSINSSCVISGTPTAVSSGSYSVTATNTAGSSTANASISVIDNAPIAKAVSGTLAEDISGIISLDYTDLDGDKASVCTVSNLNNLTLINCSCDSTGACKANVRGNSNFNGAASFSYTVTANGLLSNAATASLTITAVDDAPVAVAVSGALTEDIPGLVTLSYTDLEGDKASVCTLSSLTNLSGTCSCDTAGVCKASVTGTSNFNGAASFSYTVTANGLPSNAVTASVTINPVDDDPVAKTLSINMAEDIETQAINLEYTDAENDQASLCTTSELTNLTVTSPCSCSLGTCTVKVKGTLDYFGNASFKFNVTANGKVSNTATVLALIQAVNDAPILSSTIQNVEVNKGETKSFNLESGYDPEGSLVSYVIVTQPTLGTLTCTGGASTACSYAQNIAPGTATNDSFTYRISDGQMTSVIKTVSIKINTPCPYNYDGQCFQQKLNGIGIQKLTIDSSNGDLYIATASNGIYVSKDGGSTFQNYTTANGLGSNHVLDIRVNSSIDSSLGYYLSSVYVATNNGFSRSSNGTSFTNVQYPLSMTNYVSSISSTDSSNCFLIGLQNGVARSCDGGGSFTRLYNSNIASSVVVFPDRQQQLNNFLLQRTPPKYYMGAETLKIGPTAGPYADSLFNFGFPYTDEAFDIKINTSGTIFVAVRGGLAISTNQGASFRLVKATTPTNTFGLSAKRVHLGQNRIYLATLGGLYVSDDGGTTLVDRTTANNLGAGNLSINDVVTHGTKIYVATGAGLLIGNL